MIVVEYVMNKFKNVQVDGCDENGEKQKICIC
jgi:hypothetical protein